MLLSLRVDSGDSSPSRCVRPLSILEQSDKRGRSFLSSSDRRRQTTRECHPVSRHPLPPFISCSVWSVIRIEGLRFSFFDASHIQHRVCQVSELASHSCLHLCESSFPGEVGILLSSHSSIQDETFEQYASFLRFVKDSPLPALLYLYLFVLCRVVCLPGSSDVGHRSCPHHARGARGVTPNLLFRPLHVRDLLPLHHGKGSHGARAVGSPHPVGRCRFPFLSVSLVALCRS